MAQLGGTDNPPLFYALAVRLAEGWGSSSSSAAPSCRSYGTKAAARKMPSRATWSFTFSFAHTTRGPRRRRSGNEPKLHARCGEFDLTGI